jgi:hypothetical protein
VFSKLIKPLEEKQGPNCCEERIYFLKFCFQKKKKILGERMNKGNNREKEIVIKSNQGP